MLRPAIFSLTHLEQKVSIKSGSLIGGRSRSIPPPTFDCLLDEGRLLFIIGFRGAEPIPSQASVDKSDGVSCLLCSLFFMPESCLIDWRWLFSARRGARTSADDVWSRPKPLWTNEETGTVNHVRTFPIIP